MRIEGGVKPISREQTNDHSWELLDYGEFVVDVFQPESRDFYRLETLWVTPLLSISPKRASSIPNTASVLLSWLGT